MNNSDLSGMLEKLNIDPNSISPDMVNSFLSMLGNPKKDESSPENITSTSTAAQSPESANAPAIDMDMVFKMKSMVEKMNTNNDDPRSNLLGSLKPYLKESRKDKLDQYIQLLNMSKMIDFLPLLGGGNNKNE
ncbi:MAG: hypothetical protein FWC68_04150 [Oscillospiraceae bacterium]|nr:hypothetical protein [Oscillospiraceae bacterium]